MPTLCSADVPGEDWREVRFLRIYCELRYGETKSKTISARPRTNHREWPGHVSVIHSTFHVRAFDSG